MSTTAEKVALALRKLDSTLIANAPTSHNFNTEYDADRDISTLPFTASLKASSSLKSFHRETVSEVLNSCNIVPGSETADMLLEAAGLQPNATVRMTSTGVPDKPSGKAVKRPVAAAPVAVDATRRLQFAIEDLNAAPLNAVTPHTRLQLGASSVPMDTLKKNAKTGRPAADAEVANLLESIRINPSSPAAASNSTSVLNANMDATSTRRYSGASSLSRTTSDGLRNTQSLHASAGNNGPLGNTAIGLSALSPNERERFVKNAKQALLHPNDPLVKEMRPEKTKIVPSELQEVFACTQVSELKNDSTMRREYQYTDEMNKTAYNRDMRFNLKSNEEKRFQESRMQFDRMLKIAAKNMAEKTGKK